MTQKTFLIFSTTSIVSLVAAISIAGGVLVNAQNQTSQKLDYSDKQISAEEPNLLSSSNQDTFEIIGYGQLEIDKDYPNINLINSSENNVYLSFDVLYNDESLYKTGLISPGQMEQYNIYNKLDAGQHTLTYSINVYDTNENILWSGIQQEQEILIKN